MNFGLKDDIVKSILEVIQSYPQIEKALLFGSRARGDYKINSDIDIAIYSDEDVTGELFYAIDKASGIYKVNLVNIKDIENQRLLQNIEKDGIELYVRN